MSFRPAGRRPGGLKIPPNARPRPARPRRGGRWRRMTKAWG